MLFEEYNQLIEFIKENMPNYILYIATNYDFRYNKINGVKIGLKTETQHPEFPNLLTNVINFGQYDCNLQKIKEWLISYKEEVEAA